MAGFCVRLLPKALERASLSLCPAAALAAWFTTGQASLWNRSPLTVMPVPGLQVSPHLEQCCKSRTCMSPPIWYTAWAGSEDIPALPLFAVIDYRECGRIAC